MVDEAQFRTEVEPPHNVIVANATGIEKGTLVMLSGGNGATASDADSHGGAFAGITAVEKIASDGTTHLAVYKRGKFDLVVATGGSVTAGQLVSVSGANRIKTALAAEVEGGGIVGKALETASGDIRIQVMVGYI